MPSPRPPRFYVPTLAEETEEHRRLARIRAEAITISCPRMALEVHIACHRFKHAMDRLFPSESSCLPDTPAVRSHIDQLGEELLSAVTRYRPTLNPLRDISPDDRARFLSSLSVAMLRGWANMVTAGLAILPIVRTFEDISCLIASIEDDERAEAKASPDGDAANDDNSPNA